MLVTKIAESYAKALISLATSTKTLEFVTQDVNELLKIFHQNPDLKKALANPFYQKQLKKKILNSVTETLFLNDHTRKLLMLLIDRSRIQMFQVIGEKFLELTYKYVKIEIAQIKSAFELTNEQQLEIIEQLKSRTGANEIRLVITIDEQLLSGVIIQLGSKVIDLSLRGRLKMLAAQLETTIF
jgi:F-type H+-transporting ATPase subunit delta